MGHILARSEDLEELSGLVKTEPSPKGGGAWWSELAQRVQSKGNPAQPL